MPVTIVKITAQINVKGEIIFEYQTRRKLKFEEG